MEKQKGICILTGDKLTRENAQVDHIITKKNDGTNYIDNLRWVTKESNILKGGLNDEELKILIVKMYKQFIINQ